MRVIHKFPVQPADAWGIPVPQGSVPLYVALQGGEPQVWIERDAGASAVEDGLRFATIGTGSPFPEGGRYVGTFFTDLVGTLVFHVYDITEATHRDGGGA
jgi:hypothetical protein